VCNPALEGFNKYRKYWPDYLRRAYLQRDLKLKGHQRVIFDALSDPRYRELSDTKVCQRANELSNWNHRQKRGDVLATPYMTTEADVAIMREMIDKDINLARASSVIMTDWMEHLYFPKQFLKAIREADKIADPKEFISGVRNLYSYLLIRKREYGKEFSTRLRMKVEKPSGLGVKPRAVNEEDTEPEIYPDL
jgi:hypothetical protein